MRSGSACVAARDENLFACTCNISIKRERLRRAINTWRRYGGTACRFLLLQPTACLAVHAPERACFAVLWACVFPLPKAATGAGGSGKIFLLPLTPFAYWQAGLELRAGRCQPLFMASLPWKTPHEHFWCLLTVYLWRALSVCSWAPLSQTGWRWRHGTCENAGLAAAARNVPLP